MFGHQFYPVTRSIVEKMLAPLKHEKFSKNLERDVYTIGRTVLDPQAGKGDLLDFVNQIIDDSVETDWKRKQEWIENPCAAEIDPQLRLILNGKEIKVVAADWLLYDEPKTFDTILSNPPFDAAEKHFFQSVRYLEPSGWLVQLFNAETLRNPFTKDRRRVLDVLARNWGINPEEYGLDPQGAEPMQEGYLSSLLEALEEAGAIAWFGQCFKGPEVERSANVEVACVWYHKPFREKTFIDWDMLGSWQTEGAPKEKRATISSLAEPGAVKALVSRYNEVQRLLKERARLSMQVEELLKDVTANCMESNAQSCDLRPQKGYRKEYEITKKLFWATVFDMTKLSHRLGSEERKNFKAFVRSQGNIQFNQTNISEMINILVGDIEGAMQRLVVGVFDKMTGFHADNHKHSEGWKTNAPAKIKNRRVIFPYGIRWDGGYGDSQFRINQGEFFEDLDKALCWVTGLNHDQLKKDRMTTRQVIHAHCQKHSGYRGKNEEGYKDKFSSRFFECRIYKKGTTHLLFRDPEVAKDFAIAAAAGRKWVAEADSGMHDKPSAA